MLLGGRIKAAIEVLDDILNRKTPATLALRDWGKSNRYAGSKDRSAIGNYVYDALRCKISSLVSCSGECLLFSNASNNSLVVLSPINTAEPRII